MDKQYWKQRWADTVIYRWYFLKAWLNMPVKLDVIEGDIIPWGYGRAWRDCTRRVSVCFPIPLNWICSWTRSTYWFLVKGPENIYDRAWTDGYEMGRVIHREVQEHRERAAFERGREEGRVEIVRSIAERLYSKHGKDVKLLEGSEL